MEELINNEKLLVSGKRCYDV